VRADGVWSDERPVPEYELFFLGGARSLRGYDEDRFLGERIGVATLEYRFWLNSQANNDWLYAGYDDGGWVLTDRRSGNQSAQGWQT